MALATSLLARLLLEGREAAADPIVTAEAAAPFYYVLGTTADAGTDKVNPLVTRSFTSLAVGVGSTTVGYTGSNPDFQIGKTVLTRPAGTSQNDTNVPSLRRSGSPSEIVSAGNSVFVATAEAFALLDGLLDLPSAASASFTFTIASPVNDTPDFATGLARTPAAPLPAGAGGTVGVKPAASPPYTYSPLARVTSKSAATHGTSPAKPDAGAPKRGLAGSVPGASVFKTANAGADGSSGQTVPKISSRAMREDLVKAFYVILQQTANEANQGDATPSNLTAQGYKTARNDASSFSVSSLLNASAAAPDTTVTIPIAIVGSGSGELASSLTIFTADSMAVDGSGDSFTWFFDRGIMR